MSFVRSFFSGVESQQHFEMARDAGCEHMLMSYMYVRKQSGNILKERSKKYPHIKWLLDSGAHTIQVSMLKEPYKSWKLEDFENYVRSYVKFLRENKQYLFAAVELDIAFSINTACGKDGKDPFGDTVVDRWRKDYFVPLIKEGLDVIFVWHPSQGFEGWESLCSNYSYVGLPGEMSNNADFNTYMAVAKRYLTKLHGFAATKHKDYKDIAWFSIDSITWKAGEIYGTLPIWNERKQHYKLWDADEREQFRHIFEEQGLNADLVIAGKGSKDAYKEVTKSALKSMARMEQFYKEKFKNVIQYYELRLPAPAVVLKKSDKWVKFQYYKRFLARKNFPNHVGKRVTRLRHYLHALACVEYKDFSTLTKVGRGFLTAYFPLHMKNEVPDLNGLLKELAIMVSPSNIEAKRRETEEDYADLDTAPRRRQLDLASVLESEVELTPAQIEFLTNLPEDDFEGMDMPLLSEG